MPCAPPPPDWTLACRRLRRKLRMGWLVHHLAQSLPAASALLALMWWLLRAQRISGIGGFLLTGGLCLAGALAWALHFAFQPRCTLDSLLLRLDLGWELQSRLVSAREGGRPWPPLPAHALTPLRLRRRAWGIPLGVGISLILLGLGLPLPPESPESAFRRREPPVWRQMDQLLAEIERQALTNPESLRRWTEALRQLRSKPAESWYRPSTLEATDHLREQLQRDVHQLAEGMKRAGELLRLAANRTETFSPPQLQALRELLDALEQQLGQQGLPLGPELLAELAALDPAALAGMDPADLQRLEALWGERGAALAEAMQMAGLPGMEMGGVDRGGEGMPLHLRELESLAQAAVPLPLAAADLAQAQLGDRIREREAEHEEGAVEIQEEAGMVREAGGAGEVVWRWDLLPEENRLLRNFFHEPQPGN